MEAAAGKQLETAILGGGCFWCLEAVFKEVDGVESVESGYCGGHLEHPSYREVCEGNTGHVEVVRVRFDPTRIGYRDLLQIFFAIHDPTTPDRQGNDVGPQYRSVIFATSLAQVQIARDLIAELDTSHDYPGPIVTEVRQAPAFWPAEDYHHDYFARNGHQPYCQIVVAPKVAKFREHFANRRKGAGH